MDDAHPPDGRDRADALIRMGRHAGAIRLYQALVESFPEEESHLLALAWALYDSGNRQEAAACFERLFAQELSRKLFTGFAYDELVRIYREGKNMEGLISVCERAAAAQPEDAGVLRTLGEAYLMADRAADALRVFAQLTAREPDAPEAWCALGKARLSAGDPAGAEAACVRAVEIAPGDAAALFCRLAAGLLGTGHEEHAQAAIERALALDPADPFTLIELGELLIRRGRPEDAAAAYARAAAVIPGSAGALWYRLGIRLTKEGLHPPATEAFAKAAAAEPENPRYLLGLADSYAARGLTELAAQTLRRVELLCGSEEQ